MDFIDEEELYHLNQSVVIRPFASNAIPLLGGCDNDRCLAYFGHLTVGCISRELCTFQVQMGKFLTPISHTLGAERLGRGLVNDLELRRTILLNSSADSELEESSLATPRRGRDDNIIVGSVYRMETFGLHRVEELVWKYRTKSIW